MAERIVPRPGPSFATAAGRARIAGGSGALDDDLRRLAAGARVVHGGDAPWTVVADLDGCRLDGRPIADEAALGEVIRAGRLADVDGAFAAAWVDGAGAVHV